MNAQVIAALITGSATILAAVVSLLLARRRSRTAESDKGGRTTEADKPSTAPLTERLKFSDVAVDVSTKYWREGKRLRFPPALEARWYITKQSFDEGADLPLRATLLNTGDVPIVVSRIGVEVVKAHNSWSTGIYYGTAPKASPIKSSGHYELRLPSDNDIAEGIRAVMHLDPDSEEADKWYDIGALCSIVLPEPMYLPPAAPFMYTTNLKQYDEGMPTDAVLRLWIQTDSGGLRSDDILVTFGR